MLKEEVARVLREVVCDEVADDGNPSEAWWSALERRLGETLGAHGQGRDVSFKHARGPHRQTYDTIEKMNRLVDGPWERAEIIVWVAGEEVKITWLPHNGESPPGTFAVSPL